MAQQNVSKIFGVSTFMFLAPGLKIQRRNLDGKHFKHVKEVNIILQYDRLELEKSKLLYLSFETLIFSSRPEGSKYLKYQNVLKLAIEKLLEGFQS